jgi:hypothetical protein
VYNYSSNVLLIYPAFGDKIGQLLPNQPISLAPDNSLTFSSFSSALTVPPRVWYVTSGSSNTSGNGNVLGPNESTARDLPIFSDNSGTVLADSGIPIISIVQGPGSATIGDIATFGTAGVVIVDSGVAVGAIVQGPSSATAGDVAVFSGATGKLIQDAGIASGNLVLGPSSATSGDLAIFNGTTGKLLRDGGVAIAGLTPIVATIAALQAATATALQQTQCYVLGYAAAGDGGEGPFIVGTHTTANGGTIINDASGRSWYRLQSEDPYTMVRQWGAKGDGIHDDSTAINSATTWLNACSGGILGFNGGTFAVGTTCFIQTGVTWEGAGTKPTILIGASGTTFDVVQTLDFSSLTGTDTAGGPYQWSIRNMTIDGNKANRSSGRCAAFYGYDFIIEDVNFFNGCSDCVYSEWSMSGLVPVAAGGNSMESHWNRVKFAYAKTGNGLTFRGPHDSSFDVIEAWTNAQIGAIFATDGSTYTAAGTFLDKFHMYGNGYWGVAIADEIRGGQIESETNHTGGGIIIDASHGALQAAYVSGWGNTGLGFDDEAGNSKIAVLEAYANTSDGVHINGTGSVFGAITSYQNGGAGIYVSPASNNTQVGTTQCYLNTGLGINILGDSCGFSNVTITNNTGGGVSLGNGITGLSLSGNINNNTGTQLTMQTLGTPGGNTIDVSVFTATGQTSYSGVPGENFVRIAATGVQTVPINTSQTVGLTTSSTNTVTNKIAYVIDGNTYYLLASTSPT